MFKAGDVVLGSFATKDGRVLRHYSVVLTGNEEGAVLVYTTSLKEHSASHQVFSRDDMRSANWSNACRWDASCISLTPNSEIRKVGCISSATLRRISGAYTAAARQRSVSAARLTTDRQVVPM